MSSRASQEDLEFGERVEQLAAELLAKRLWPDAQVKKRSKYSHLDFGVVKDGRPVALLEVKARRNASGDYPTTAVNWDKYISAKHLGRTFKVKTACLVVFTDRVGYFWLDERPDGKGFIARDDRGGEGCDHALYNIERVTWVDGLKEELEAALRASETPQNGAATA